MLKDNKKYTPKPVSSFGNGKIIAFLSVRTFPRNKNSYKMYGHSHIRLDYKYSFRWKECNVGENNSNSVGLERLLLLPAAWSISAFLSVSARKTKAIHCNELEKHCCALCLYQYLAMFQLFLQDVFAPPPCSQKLEKISKLDLALFFLGMDHWHFKCIHTVHVATQEKHIRLK